MRKADPYDRTENDRLPIRRDTKMPFSIAKLGARIQLLFTTMIQKALKVVPSATIMVENRYTSGGTRLRPKIKPPKNEASGQMP
jgi:hypothetical protein